MRAKLLGLAMACKPLYFIKFLALAICILILSSCFGGGSVVSSGEFPGYDRIAYRYKFEHMNNEYTRKAGQVAKYRHLEDFSLYEHDFYYDMRTKHYHGKYPTYDPDVDNQYPVEEDYDYLIYDSGADNPIYPQFDYDTQYERQIYDGYYPTYHPEADNPYHPPAPKDSQFNKPMFDKPMFLE